MFDQITLPNGLRVVGEKLGHIHSCTVGVWVKVGSVNELPEENGLSHFIEHMVFKGTKNRTARQIAEEMDMVGGQLNAFTSKECTCFYAKVIDEDLKLAVDILSDLALRPTFDEKELNKERGVVLEEIAMVDDTPEDMVHELLAEAQFDGSLSMPILGPRQRIAAYSRDDLLGYWRRHYVPRNMVVSIAGNYDWDAFLSLVNQYFDAFPNPNAEETPDHPQTFRSGRLAREKDTEQLHICMGFEGVPSGSDELYDISVFNNVLGGGMSSRLFQRIREEMGAAYSVYSFPSTYTNCGTFTVYAGTSPETAQQLADELLGQIRLLRDGGVTQEEFDMAKEQLKVSYVLGLESSSARMSAIGRSKLLRGHAVDPQDVIRKIEAVTKEDVERVAHRMFGRPFSASAVGRNIDGLKLL